MFGVLLCPMTGKNPQKGRGFFSFLLFMSVSRILWQESCGSLSLKNLENFGKDFCEHFTPFPWRQEGKSTLNKHWYVSSTMHKSCGTTSVALINGPAFCRLAREVLLPWSMDGDSLSQFIQ